MHQAVINIQEVRQSISVFVDDQGVIFGVIPPQPELPAGIVFSFDNGALPLANGSPCDIVLPFDVVIDGVDLIAPLESGDIVVDLLITDFATFPGGFVSIVNTTPPTLSESQKYEDTELAGWTTNFVKQQILRASISGVVDITKISLTLSVTKHL